MAKPIRFTPKNSPSGWRINIPAKISETGKRQQLFYRTQKLALAAADDLKRKVELFGVQTRAISPTVAEQATAALNLLEPYGITLLEAARRIAEIESMQRRSSTVEDALNDYEAAKGGRSDRHTRTITYMSRHLREDFPQRMISSITPNELQVHLEARTGGPTAFNDRLRLLTGLWRWAAKPPREWCNPDTLKHLERKEAVTNEISTLTAKEAATLLTTAEKHFTDTVIPFAIALFTGMRMQEIERLKPEDIAPEGITVSQGKSKTKQRRFIQMPDPLAAWLNVYPITDCVCPPNWSRKEKAVRRLAGWKVWSDIVPTLKLKTPMQAEPPETAPEWPQNALRHTAASVALALGKDLQTLIFEHGHSGGTEMLRKHYIGRMPKKEAQAIWTLGPKGKKLPTMKIA
jgi:integrase